MIAQHNPGTLEAPFQIHLKRQYLQLHNLPNQFGISGLLETFLSLGCYSSLKKKNKKHPFFFKTKNNKQGKINKLNRLKKCIEAIQLVQLDLRLRSAEVQNWLEIYFITLSYQCSCYAQNVSAHPRFQRVESSQTFNVWPFTLSNISPSTSAGGLFCC